MEFNRLTNKYCVCRRCWGEKVNVRDCPCRVCSKCVIHMGKLHVEGINEFDETICNGCFRICNLKINCDLRGFGLLLYGIYDRAYNDAVNEEPDERDNALRWIKSESFFYFSNMLGMKPEGLREGMLERIERTLKKQKRI